MDDELRIPASELRAFATEVARSVGVPADDAEIIADGMVWAELRGLNIGIRRLPMLVARIRGGGTVADPKPTVVRETGAFAVLDGRGAWGQVTSVRAMLLAIAKARDSGVGVCVVRDTGNSLAMGYYPWLATRDRMIGIAITNALPLQAAWGATKKLLGNQAYAFGIPARRHPPIVFDTATTAITWVGIHAYEARGESLPPGVALDPEGRPTTDPHEALAGLLLPAGGHRGFGLALIWEVLTGVLSGGEHFAPLPDSFAPASRGGQSTFLLAIDPSAALPYDTFVDRVDALIDRIHASPPAPGVDAVRVPGERGAALAAEREATGLPFAAERIAELRRLAEDVGVKVPASFGTTPVGRGSR